jgi:negative regulator of flagellin synthesis FlgM
MRIGPKSAENIRAESPPPALERANVARTRTPVGPVGGAAGAERVSLSGAHASMTAAAAAYPFDDRKVEEVRRAIAEGRFPVDARAVAEYLIADARELLGVPVGARPGR